MGDAQCLVNARQAYSRGDISSAAKFYQSVLDECPGNRDEAFQILGVIAQRMGKMELALQLTEAALGISPNMASALVNRAVFLRHLGRKQDARDAVRVAMEKCPGSATVWHTASFLALEYGEHENAYKWACKSVELDPEAPLALINYANTLMVRGDLAPSYDAARKALGKAPGEPLMHLSIGQILRAAGYPLRAVSHFREAYKLRPNYTDAKAAEATALTVAGDWKQGWAAWENRPYDKERFKALPRWDGKPVGVLLLHAEQGMGDALQFLRWVYMLDSLAQKIILQVPKPLLELVSNSFRGYQVITPDDQLPEVDAHCPLMSVPHLMNPCEANYLSPAVLSVNETARKKWRETLARYPGPHAGLVWYGNPKHTNDHNRSIPKNLLQPLLEKFSDNIFSLQDGIIARLDQGRMNFVPIDADNPHGISVVDTAALMKELDLVITVDTMPAHLAGTLGVPTWLLVPFDPDWRWLYGREDTLWYPAMRLFRQPKPRDWQSVIARVISDMEKLCAGDKSALVPQKWSGPDLTQHPQAVPLNFEE